MTATAQLIDTLIAGGMSAAEAAGLVARAAVEMTGALTKKSSGAARQQRYRERNKASLTVTPEQAASVTNRNESVTERNEDTASRTVTNRNEAVTTLHPADSALSYLLTSSSKNLEKKEKKERAKSSRGEKLPPDMKPTAEHYEQGLALGFGRDWVDEQFENMRIWARANEHRAVARKSDWDLTFTGWLRRTANDSKGRNNGKVSTISSACDNLIDKLNAGFGGPAPEERLRGGESEVDARLLSYRRS